jgi:hypothetical protein
LGGKQPGFQFCFLPRFLFSLNVLFGAFFGQFTFQVNVVNAVFKNRLLLVVIQCQLKIATCFFDFGEQHATALYL